MHQPSTSRAASLALVALVATGVSASAQTVGTFSWQQQPYCNVLTMTVVQVGAVYQLDGTDDQCGATRKASVTGLAFPNPDGSIGMGLTLVTNSAGATGGAPLHIDATISLATVGGTWRDNTGASGPLVLAAGPGAGGSPRPTPVPVFAGGLTAGPVFGTSTRVRVGSDLPPAMAGVRGESVQGVGVYGRGDVSNTYSFFNEGGYFEGGKGLYARGTDPSSQQGYGARIYSDQYRGLYVQGATAWYDAYFGGDAGISTAGIVNRSADTSLAVNLGESDIAPGDLVALAGVAASAEHGRPLLGVAKVNASNRGAVIGVAVSAFVVGTVAREDGRGGVDFSPAPGAAEPSGYLNLITSGLAPAVNLESLAVAADGRATAAGTGLEAAAVGDRVELASNGAMIAAATGSGGVSIGKVAAPADKVKGTIALFLQIK